MQSIADTEWRLLRIPSLEMGIYALGHLEFSGQFANEDSAVRKSLIEAQIFRSYRKDLNNLSIQESRLRRQREKDTAELKQLQHERCERTRRESKPRSARELPSNGFEFSTVEIECNVDRVSSSAAEHRLESKTVAA